MTADRLALAVRTRKARRDGTCTICRVPIMIGQPIARLISPAGWCHVRCVPHVARALNPDVRPEQPGGKHGRNTMTGSKIYTVTTDRQQMIYEYAMAVVSLNEDTISYGQMPDLIRLLGTIVQELDATSVTDDGCVIFDPIQAKATPNRSWEHEADLLIHAELADRGIVSA